MQMPALPAGKNIELSRRKTDFRLSLSPRLTPITPVAVLPLLQNAAALHPRDSFTLSNPLE
jgi:hypothetical protein